MRFLRRGLLRRLMAYFMLLSLVPLTIVGYLAYESGRQALQKHIADHLTSVAILKEQEINRWIDEEEGEIELFASLAVIRENLVPLLSQDKAGRDYETAYENMANYLRITTEREQHFPELFVLSADEGKVLVSTDGKQEGKYKEDRPYFVEGRKGTYVQNVYHSLTLGAPAMTIAAPIKDEKGQVTGVLAGRVDLERLSEVMRERSGLGETGETYLVNKYEFFVTESRFEPGYPFRHGIHTLGVEEALRGNDGMGLYEDYRGVPVIGAYRWMEDRELALLAEMDQAEAFAPIRRMRDVMIGIAIVVAIAVLFVGVISTRAITVPIFRLVSAAEAIGRGELEQRVEVGAKDEMGRLADVFNKMALDLRRSRAEVEEYSRSLERKVAERTRELEEANKDLEETRDALLYMLEDINEANAELQQARAELQEYSQTLEDKVEERTKELSALNAIAATVSESLDLEEILDATLDKVLEVMGVEAGEIFLVEEGSRDLVLASHRGLFPDSFREITRFRLGEGFPGLVAQSGELLLTTELAGNLRYLRRDVIEAGFGSFACIPLKAKEKVLGTLDVAAVGRRPFGAEDIALLTSIGHQIGVAIENARLYGQVEERARELNRDLMAQKQYAENVLQSIADGVYSVDRRRVVLSWSQGAEAITGYTAEEAIGRPCTDFLRHTDEAGHPLCDTPACPLATVMTSGKPISTKEVYGHAVDGRAVPLAVTAAPIFDERGLAVGAVEVFRDVSKERELMERIQAASRAKSEFLASMSHELRTPLNAVIGFSQVLQEQHFGELNEKQAEYVGDILESGKHLLSLINDVLDLSKIEAGKMELELSRVNIEELLEDSLVMIKQKCLKHGISLDLRTPQELAGLNVTADERKLKQVMFNLLSNAAKFTPDGGAIAVEARQEGEELIISVSDTGIGIAPEHQGKIFEEFYQVRGDMRGKTPGTGLGLSLTKRILDVHGGKMWVESEGEGKGSRFSFTLPIRGND